MRAHGFWYRLLFTRDDDLDVLQVLFLVIVLATLGVIWRVVTPGASDAVVESGMVTLRWMVGLLAVTAVPKWLVPEVVKVLTSKFGANAVAPREPIPPTLANVWTDDERDDRWPDA